MRRPDSRRPAGRREELAFEDLGGQGLAVDGTSGCWRLPPRWWIVRATSRLPVPGSPTTRTGTSRGGREPDLFEEPRVGRAGADQRLEAVRPVEPVAELHQPDAELLGPRVGRRWGALGLAHLAEDARGARRPGRGTARTRSAARAARRSAMEEQGAAAGGPAGDGLRGRVEARGQVGGLAALDRAVRPQTSPTTDSAGWPVSSSQAWLTHAPGARDRARTSARARAARAGPAGTPRRGEAPW